MTFIAFIAVSEVVYERGVYRDNPILINITDISTVKKSWSKRRPTIIKMKGASVIFCKDEFETVQREIWKLKEVRNGEET